MLGRAADQMFWLARSMERAENTARAMEAAIRAGLMSDPAGGRLADWSAPLRMHGLMEAFRAHYDDVSQAAVLRFMVAHRDNPSSIHSSLWLARENARAVRHRLPNDVWEAINQTWLQIAQEDGQVATFDIESHLEWVRGRVQLYRGAMMGSMRRADGYHFIALGAALERADNTARTLRSQWGWLTTGVIAGQVDYFRAAILLNSLSAFRAYREIYSANLAADKIAELLILRPDMPRSIAACLDEAAAIYDLLDARVEAAARAQALRARIAQLRMADLLRVGLDGFLEDCMAETATIATLTQRNFMMVE